MTRDELRREIGRASCALNDMPGECAHCEADKGCPDSWPDDAKVVDAIMALVDTYSVAIVQGVTPSYLPKPTDEEVLAWLKARK